MLTNEIKLAARISHDSLDSDVIRAEKWAQAELIRVGVPADHVNAEENPLITDAIICGALSKILTDDDKRAEAKENFLTIQDNLRKHIWPAYVPAQPAEETPGGEGNGE